MGRDGSVYCRSSAHPFDGPTLFLCVNPPGFRGATWASGLALALKMVSTGDQDLCAFTGRDPVCLPRAMLPRRDDEDVIRAHPVAGQLAQLCHHRCGQLQGGDIYAQLNLGGDLIGILATGTSAGQKAFADRGFG